MNVFVVRPRLLFFLCLYVAGCLLFLTSIQFPFLPKLIKRLELTSYTWRMELRGPMPHLSSIVMAVIDDRSVKELGRWPWPRSIHCELIKKLRDAGVSVIVFDIVFTEQTNKSEDEALVNCVTEKKDIVVAVEKSPFRDTLQTLMPGLTQAALSTGHTSTFADFDGIIRRIPLIDYNIPSLSLAPLQGFYKIKQDDIPKEKGNSLLINYYGPPGTFKRFSYVDLLRGNFIKEQIENKLVLVGSIRDIGDFKRTSFAHGNKLNDQMPGLEIHANAINTILSKEYIKTVPDNIFHIILFIYSLMVVIILEKVGFLRGGVFLCGTLGVYATSAIYLFISKNIWINITLPLSLYVFYMLGTVLYENRAVYKLLGRLVPDKLAKEFLSGSFKGKNREVEASILFVDIKGYTGLAERFSPNQVLELLNECYTSVEPFIKKEGGVICDYQGDAIMVFFTSAKGTPSPVKNHALAALKTAISIKNVIIDLNERRKTKEGPTIEIGCGISSGTVTWGWFGKEEHLQVAVLGDTTNTSARLQALSKEMGYSIMLSESAVNMLPPGTPVHYVTEVLLKGKTVSTRVFGFND